MRRGSATLTDSWHNFTLELLTQASDLACVEGAQGTFRLLTCAHRLLRYLSLEDEWAPFHEEIESLKDYISIRQARFGNRIYLAPCAPDSRFVKRTGALTFLGRHASAEALVSDPNAEWFVSFEARGRALIMAVRCASAAGDALHEMEL